MAWQTLKDLFFFPSIHLGSATLFFLFNKLKNIIPTPFILRGWPLLRLGFMYCYWHELWALINVKNWFPYSTLFPLFWKTNRVMAWCLLSNTGSAWTQVLHVYSDMNYCSWYMLKLGFCAITWLSFIRFKEIHIVALVFSFLSHQIKYCAVKKTYSGRGCPVSELWWIKLALAASARKQQLSPHAFS